MTEDHESLPEPGDELILNEALSHLKQLDPPLESRVANRLAVTAALDELNAAKQRRQLPWWRRSIAVPVPAAACLLVLTGLAVSANFRSGQEQVPLHVTSPQHPAVADGNQQSGKSSIAQRPPRSRVGLKFYETETYLCGIGRVSSESHYSPEE